MADTSEWTAPVVLLLDLVELRDRVTTHKTPFHVVVTRRDLG
jgi:hypothetical protein